MWLYMAHHAKTQYCAIVFLLFQTILATICIQKDLHTKARAVARGTSNIQLDLQSILLPRDPTNTPGQRTPNTPTRQGTSGNSQRIASPVSSSLRRQHINAEHGNHGPIGHSGENLHRLVDGYKPRTSASGILKPGNESPSKRIGKLQVARSGQKSSGLDEKKVGSPPRGISRRKGSTQEQKDRRAARERERRRAAKEPQNFAQRKWPYSNYEEQKENTAIGRKNSNGASDRKRAPIVQEASLGQTVKRVKIYHGTNEQKSKANSAEGSSSGNRNPLHELPAISSTPKPRQQKLMSLPRPLPDSVSISSVSAKPHMSKLSPPDDVSIGSKSVDLHAYEQLPVSESEVSSGRHRNVRPAQPFIRLLPSKDKPSPSTKPPERMPAYSWDSIPGALLAFHPAVKLEQRTSSENTMRQMHRTSNAPSPVPAAKPQTRTSSENTIQQIYRSFRTSSPASSQNTMRQIYHAIVNDEL